MTKELNQQATEVGADEKFPDFPPRDEMENTSIFAAPVIPPPWNATSICLTPPLS